MYTPEDRERVASDTRTIQINVQNFFNKNLPLKHLRALTSNPFLLLLLSLLFFKK